MLKCFGALLVGGIILGLGWILVKTSPLEPEKVELSTNPGDVILVRDELQTPSVADLPDRHAVRELEESISEDPAKLIEAPPSVGRVYLEGRIAGLSTKVPLDASVEISAPAHVPTVQRMWNFGRRRGKSSARRRSTEELMMPAISLSADVDSSGHFRADLTRLLATWEETAVTVSIRPTWYLADSVVLHVPRLDPDEVQPVQCVLALRPVGVITGSVVDGSNRRPHSGSVAVFKRAGMSVGGEPIDSTHLERDGSFSLRTDHEGSHLIIAIAETVDGITYVPGTESVLSFVGQKTAVPTIVVAYSELTLSGNIRVSGGNTGPLQLQATLLEGGDAISLGAKQILVASNGSAKMRTHHTPADGNFVFRGVSEGRYKISISTIDDGSPIHPSAQRMLVEAVAPAQDLSLTQVLHMIPVHVVDRAEPIPGAKVSIYGGGGSWDGTADLDGMAQCLVEGPGAFRVVVNHPGYYEYTQAVDLDSGSKAGVLAALKSPNDGLVEFRVHSPSRAEVSRVSVRLKSLEPNNQDRLAQSSPHEGVLTLRGVKAGNYQVEMMATLKGEDDDWVLPFSQQMNLTDEDSEAHHVTFKLGGRLVFVNVQECRVLDGEGQSRLHRLGDAETRLPQGAYKAQFKVDGAWWEKQVEVKVRAETVIDGRDTG